MIIISLFNMRKLKLRKVKLTCSKTQLERDRDGITTLASEAEFKTSTYIAHV